MIRVTDAMAEDGNHWRDVVYGYGNVKQVGGKGAVRREVMKPMPSVSTPSKSDVTPKKKSSIRTNMDGNELLNVLHGSDLISIELNRLENEVRDKDRELGDAQAEIKSLKLTERLKEKAVEQLTEELRKVDEKLKTTEALLENKNLEIKKINDEKKAALAAQFAAEGTLRRVHAAQQDDDMSPIEAIIAPLEAELKLSRQEIAKLQEDDRALERVIKSKEVALLEAERTVQIALAKSSMVEHVQNRNQELMKQIEICQEENKILDKMHRQKVSEVEKLSQTVHELEEAVLSGGGAANAVRDYQRQVHGLIEEKKTLDRELARTKVTANRVATAVANEWKDSNGKVMPVKQWLEERRFMQGELQQLRDKLAIAERAAKTEAQLKEKFLQRLKVLEGGLKSSSNSAVRSSSVGRSSSNAPLRRQSMGGAETLPKIFSSGLRSRTTISQPRTPISSSGSPVLKHAKETSKSFDGGKTLERNKSFMNGFEQHWTKKATVVNTESHAAMKEISDNKPSELTEAGPDDSVSGFLYDMLQKEVIGLRKASHEKDQSLKDKDDAIEMLGKKVDTLTKAMEVEAKKMRRELSAMEKEVAAIRVAKEDDQRRRRLSSPKGPVNSSHRVSGRYALPTVF